jgi:hypothetical protein
MILFPLSDKKVAMDSKNAANPLVNDTIMQYRKRTSKVLQCTSAAAGFTG